MPSIIYWTRLILPLANQPEDTERRNTCRYKATFHLNQNPFSLGHQKAVADVSWINFGKENIILGL